MGRQAVIDASVRAWREMDRLPSREVEKQIQEFLLLRVEHPHHWSKNVDDFTDIDPVGACLRVHLPVLVNEYESNPGQKLTPVGFMGCGVLVFAGQDGTIYGGHSPYLGRYGDSFYSFMNLLFSDRRPVVLSS